MGSLDLSALDLNDEETRPTGDVLRAPLTQFIPDEKQLNRERDKDADDRDREDIVMRGILQPIVVSKPDDNGKMHIRLGHRRWRLSQEAGLPDIPYVFEIGGTVYDDYAKLAENRKRKNESPMDIAILIAERKANGEKNKYIAAQIGIDAAEITHHLVLIEGQDYIRELYTNGKCKTPKYLYELSNLAKDHPAQVEEFCAESTEFTRNAIDVLKQKIGNTKKNNQKNNENADSTHDNQFEHQPTSDEGEQNNNDTSDWPFSPQPQNEHQPESYDLPHHNPDTEKDNNKPTTDKSKIKKPLILGTYDNQDIMVMIHKRPTTPGLVFIKYENGMGEDEIAFAKITNLTLTDSQV